MRDTPASSASPTLSVGLVTYHTAFDTLVAAVASLRRSSVAYTLCIIDNSMDDAYFAALEALQLAPCVRAPRNGGYGYGHNVALMHLPNAPYHLVMNPDVEIHEGCLEALLAAMDRQPEIGLAVPKVYSTDGSIQQLNKRDVTVFDCFVRRFIPKPLQRIPMIRRRFDYFVMMDKGYDTSYEIAYASGCFMLFRRACLNAIGGFDERYFMHFEDADITRAIRAIAKVMYVPQAAITHAWARSSHTSLKFTLITIRSAYLFFHKWGWRWW